MILDSSAIVALLRKEPGHQRLCSRLERAAARGIGGPTLFETAMVVRGRFGTNGLVLLERFLDDWEVQVIPFGESHWRAAMEAFTRYGKGRHPAGLNYGDCMTYASARVAEMPLLFIGNDFAKTDIPPA
ncbi:MAG TPA: type II toxin-antitoxin system VapC family toxin [Solirubrobacterales bacterium]|nr:type II toxin-antitoxin system VapC family toxin [Solirubrobacterales bacterium]